jgi:hypothetical protein
LRHLLTWQMRWPTVVYPVTGKLSVPASNY